jgi:D-alanine--poly(phosphoribitol) ligase subunit 2
VDARPKERTLENGEVATYRRNSGVGMYEKIRQYLSETLLIEFSDDSSGVSEGANLFESGLIDSFGFVQLVAFLEKEFDINISDDELLSDSLSSFAKIRAFVESKVGQ